MVLATIDIPIEEIRVICRRYRIRELSIFGSALRDDFRADSDIDLLVEFHPDAKIGFMALGEIEDAFSAVLHRDVDLVPKGGLKPIIRDDVLASAQVLYAESATLPG